MANHTIARPRNTAGQVVRGAAPAHATPAADNNSAILVGHAIIATGSLFLAALGSVVVAHVLGRPVGVTDDFLLVAGQILIHYVLPFVALNAMGVALVLLIQWIAVTPDDAATIKQQLRQ
jgi:hypothetical protein